MFFFGLLRVLLIDNLKAIDAGGSMTIHMFGAYFGMTSAYFFQNKFAQEEKFTRHKQDKGTYDSFILASIGTLFLFVYWPSFNSALSFGVAQQRAALNTFYAITSSALMAGFISRVVYNHMFDMEIIVNATLAGGVMIAGACELILNPGWAILVGGFAGMSSALAFAKLKSFTADKMKLHDSCGVQYLHGIPGQLGAVTVAIFCGAALSSYDNQFLLE